MSLFPPPSSRTPSRSSSPSRPDSLIAHPLLASPSTASSPTGTTITTNASAPSSTPPKYVTYTPRGHRGATTAITTSATTSTAASSVTHQNGKNIQRKLQITNLQSVAQGLGLDVTSVGWAILEWLVIPAVGNPTEQKEIWETVSNGKVTLLLPLEQQSSTVVVSAEFVKDHILLVSDDKTHAVTLSGLRGTMEDTQFTVVSSLSPSHPAFTALLSPETRADGFASLPPLPLFNRDKDLKPAYNPPSYKLPTFTPSLPLPSPNPPALPPRPGLTGSATTPSTTGGHSRLSTLASLFGGRGNASPSQAAPAQLNADPLAGIQPTTATPASQAAPPLSQIPAYTVTCSISRAYVGSSLEQFIKHSILSAYTNTTVALDKEDLDWLCGATFEVASPFLPLLKVKSGSPARRISRRARQESNSSSIASFSTSDVWSVPFYDFDCQTDGNGKSSLVDAIQDGYLVIEKGARERLAKKYSSSEEGNDKDDKVDDAVGSVMAVAETVITGLLYDRLYGGTEDTAHDLALRERAENLCSSSMGLKELGLIVKHLVVSDHGPDIEENTEGAVEVVDSIVGKCAEVLSRLDGDSARSPAIKAQLLVEAHRVFVTGFSSSNAHGVWVEAHEEPKQSPSEPTAELELVASPPPERKKTVVSSPPPLSSDLLLPLLIYTIIRYPSICASHLLSNLLFVQRFRCEEAAGADGGKTGRGEEAYCLVNLVAGVEYVVSLASPEEASSKMDGMPIPGTKTPPSPIAMFHQSPSGASTKSLPPNSSANTPSSTIFGTSLPSELNISSLRDIDMGAALRGRVDVLTGSANKVISGMVGSSFGILKSLTLPSNAADAIGDTRSDTASVNSATGVVTDTLPVDGEKTSERPGALGILTGRTPSAGSGLSSIRNMLPSRLGSAAPQTSAEENGRPMVVVSGSRPGSLRAPQSDVEEYTDEESGSEEGEGESNEEEEGSDDGEDEDDGNELERPYEPDTRSIRSFESMMRSSSGKSLKKRGKKRPRKSLTDRLADMSGGLAAQIRGSPRNSILIASQTVTSPISSTVGLQLPHHPQISIAPPIERFMTCDPLDLKIGEIDSLLLDYRRLVREIRAADGFAADLNSSAS